MFQLIANGDLVGLQEELRNIEYLSLPERAVLSMKDGGKTLLHAAIEKGDIAILKALLVAGVPLNINDDTGQPILHAAVRKGYMEIIQELIALDVSLTELDQAGKTAENIAQEMESQGNSDIVLYKEIGALLRTRREWQETSVSFRFNKVMHMITEIFAAIKPARGYDKIFFIGSTGAGKSTLLNYLNGARYRVDKDEADKPFAELIEGEEIAIVGQGMDSQTLYPQIVPEKSPKVGTNFVYCDLAGLADKGGPERKIIAASSVQALSRLPGNIKGMLVVLDIPGFNAGKAETFINTAVAFAKMINFNTALMDSVYFVITKASSRVKPKAIKTTYIRPKLESLRQKKLVEHVLNKEEEALHFMLEQMMLSKDDKFLIPNITDQGESRELMEEKFNKLIAQDASLFNFINYDGSQEKFISLLEKIAKGFVEKKNKLEKYFPDKISETIKLKNLENLRQEELKKAIIVKDNEVSKYTKAISGIETLISDLDKQRDSNSNELKRIISFGHDNRCDFCRTNKEKLEKTNEDLRNNILNQGKEKVDVEYKIVMLNEEIETLTHEKSLIEEIINEFNKQIEILESDIKNLKLEIEVNQNLFEIVNNVTHILDLGFNDIILHFWKEYNQTNIVTYPICDNKKEQLVEDSSYIYREQSYLTQYFSRIHISEQEQMYIAIALSLSEDEQKYKNKLTIS